MAMLNAAMLSGWHVHAKGYARELLGMRDVRVTAVWDEIPDRGAEWAKELGTDFEPDLNRLLKRDDVDAVVICAPTDRHESLMVAAAEAGKHIFTEKVMATTTAGCLKAAEAIRKAGVKFCISFPMRTRSPILFAKKVLDEQLLGQVTLLRIRNAHNGAIADWLPAHFYDPVQCGGGAMMDLGAHPMYLSRWLMGRPVRITSLFNHITGRAVEDNAVSVIEFANGAIGISETGFVSVNSPFSLEMHGTEGCFIMGGPDGRDKVSLTSKKLKLPMGGWVVNPQALPEALPPALRQWVSGILQGTPIHFGLEDGIRLTRLMEAAYLSHREKRQVEIDDPDM